MTYIDDRVARLHGLLKDVRGAADDARDFAWFEKHDDLKRLGVDPDVIDNFDARDTAALDQSIAATVTATRGLGRSASGNLNAYGVAQAGPIAQPYQRNIRERFVDNFNDAYRNSPGGLRAEWLIQKALPDLEADHERERVAERKRLFRMASDADPWTTAPDNKILHGAAALSGQIAGRLVSPEAWLGAAGAEFLGLSKAAQAVGLAGQSAVDAIKDGHADWLRRQVE